jgi:hypothetical protein
VLTDEIRVVWITREEDARLTALGYRKDRPGEEHRVENHLF